jgi:nucleotidyltransferase substrate binding protein (TIGR01987 family)
MKAKNMSNELKLSFDKLEKALKSLETMVNEPMHANRMNIDATIQRFEFSIELFWKLLQKILASKGEEVIYPKDVLKSAYKGHLINNEQTWLAMTKDRNLTSHTYNEELADTIYKHIKEYFPIMLHTFNDLEKKYRK